MGVECNSVPNGRLQTCTVVFASPKLFCAFPTPPPLRKQDEESKLNEVMKSMDFGFEYSKAQERTYNTCGVPKETLCK
eukprot:7773648-Alexandrium_andersonii.AAC.1